MPQTASPVDGRGGDGATSRDEVAKTVAAAERDAREAADWAQIEIVEPQRRVRRAPDTRMSAIASGARAGRSHRNELRATHARR